jgi:phage FluMu protein Com
MVAAGLDFWQVQNIRCGKCRALLFRCEPAAIARAIEIKCRRCGTINLLRPLEPAPERREREGE